MLLRQVVQLCAVGFEIVQFPAAGMPGNQLPLAPANGAVALVFPVDRFALNRFIVESRRQRASPGRGLEPFRSLGEGPFRHGLLAGKLPV